MKIATDTRNRIGYAEVAGLKLRYIIDQPTSEVIASIRADILRGEDTLGSINIYRDGRMYISLNKEGALKSSVERIALLTQASNDAETLFNEPTIQTV